MFTLIIQQLKNLIPNIDAYKLRGITQAPQIYTSVKETDLTINSLPVEPMMVIPMGLEVGAEGDYKIFATEMGYMEDNDRLYLEDKLLDQKILLSENDFYEFSASPDDDPDRFNLHFTFDGNDPFSKDDINEVKIYSIEKEVFVQLQNSSNCKIYVFDLMGKLITEGYGYNNSLNKLKVNSKTGIYIVKVIDNENVFSEKVFIE